MSTIKIDDLRPTGAELFSDSESYMNELGDSELDIYGGRTTPLCRAISRSTVRASRKVVEASRAVSRDPKGAARRVSRFISGATIWELSNPFNSF